MRGQVWRQLEHRVQKQHQWDMKCEGIRKLKAAHSLLSWWKQKERWQGNCETEQQDKHLIGRTPMPKSTLSELLLLVAKASTLLYKESLVPSESSEDHLQGLMGCVNEMRGTVR